MSQQPQISARAWRWAIGWSITILLLSCVPYLIAWRLAPAGWQFAGLMVNPLDGHSYLAKMQQGAVGSWLFHLTYTPEPHRGAFIFTFYLALGHLAALTGLPAIWVFHLARLAAGFLLLMAAFRFIALVTPHTHERRLAFILLISASGLGWLGVIFGAFPIDLWVPEAFVPYSLYTNPHFPLGMALMLTVFQLVISNYQLSNSSLQSQSSILQSAIRNPQSAIRILPAGVAALALALILPFALLTVWAILAVYIIWLYVAYRRLPWPLIWPTLGVGLFSAPVIGYDYWVSTTHPILSGWAAQNVTEAPPPLDLILGYGPVGLLAVAGGWLIVRRQEDHSTVRAGLPPGEWLLLVWAVTTLVLVYLPFDLQRRLINGLHIPLCLLAAIGLARGLDGSRLKAGQRRLITNGVITLGAVGTLFVWLLPLLGMLQAPGQSQTTALFFLRYEERVALDWLRENGQAGETVLASPRLGMFVPGQTGLHAFYGHPFETIEAGTKKARAEAFFRGEIEQVLPPVDFIIYGPSEQALGRPESLANYPVVFSANGLSVFEVIP